MERLFYFTYQFVCITMHFMKFSKIQYLNSTLKVRIPIQIRRNFWPALFDFRCRLNSKQFNIEKKNKHSIENLAHFSRLFYDSQEVYSSFTLFHLITSMISLAGVLFQFDLVIFFFFPKLKFNSVINNYHKI